MEKLIVILSIVTSSLLSSEINIELNNLQPTCGSLKIGLYHSKTTFLSVKKAFRHIKSNKISTKVYRFQNIPNGIYAIALFCDENHNGKLDTNFFGIPKEAYGFSNNPKVLGKPDFDDAKFELEESINLVIKVQK